MLLEKGAHSTAAHWPLERRGGCTEWPTQPINPLHGRLALIHYDHLRRCQVNPLLMNQDLPPRHPAGGSPAASRHWQQQEACVRQEGLKATRGHDAKASWKPRLLPPLRKGLYERKGSYKGKTTTFCGKGQVTLAATFNSHLFHPLVPTPPQQHSPIFFPSSLSQACLFHLPLLLAGKDPDTQLVGNETPCCLNSSDSSA